MPGLGDGAGDDLLDVGPDLGGVVLDPARLREDLLVLLLVDGDDAAVAVEDDAAAGGGALVDGGDERAGGVASVACRRSWVLRGRRSGVRRCGVAIGPVRLRRRRRCRCPPARAPPISGPTTGIQA